MKRIRRVDLFSAADRVFWEKSFNPINANVPTPCVSRSSVSDHVMNYVGNCIIVFHEEGFELFSVILIQHIKSYELFLKVYFVSWYLVKVEKYLYSCSLLFFLLLLDIFMFNGEVSCFKSWSVWSYRNLFSFYNWKFAYKQPSDKIYLLWPLLLIGFNFISDMDK